MISEKYLECNSARSEIFDGNKSGRGLFGDIIKKDEIIRVNFNICSARNRRFRVWERGCKYYFDIRKD